MKGRMGRQEKEIQQTHIFMIIHMKINDFQHQVHPQGWGPNQSKVYPMIVSFYQNGFSLMNNLEESTYIKTFFLILVRIYISLCVQTWTLDLLCQIFPSDLEEDQEFRIQNENQEDKESQQFPCLNILLLREQLYEIYQSEVSLYSSSQLISLEEYLALQWQTGWVWKTDMKQILYIYTVYP